MEMMRRRIVAKLGTCLFLAANFDFTIGKHAWNGAYGLLRNVLCSGNNNFPFKICRRYTPNFRTICKYHYWCHYLEKTTTLTFRCNYQKKAGSFSINGRNDEAAQKKRHSRNQQQTIQVNHVVSLCYYLHLAEKMAFVFVAFFTERLIIGMPYSNI